MIGWVAGLHPAWYEAVAAWLAIVAFWFLGPFALSWLAAKFQRLMDRREAMTGARRPAPLTPEANADEQG